MIIGLFPDILKGMSSKCTYKLIGGALDGDSGEHDVSDGVVEDMILPHPEIPTLLLHYTKGIMELNDDGDPETVLYSFVREVNRTNLDEYAKYHLSAVGDSDG